MRPLRVLYIHMWGAFGGASRSLHEAVKAFPEGSVQAMFVTQRGSACKFFSEVGEVIEARGLTQFDNTRYSHYRGVRWLVLLRELALLPATVLAVRRARRLFGSIDLIHLNEITGLVPLWLARRSFGVPAIVHVRSIAWVNPGSFRCKWLNNILKREAAAVVAIDSNVRDSLPRALPVEVIHNAFSPHPNGTLDQKLKRRLGLLRPESFKVGFVGNLLRVKGIIELIEAARLTRDRGLDIEFIVVGDNTGSTSGLRALVLKSIGLRQDAREEVEQLLDRYALRDRVHLVGFTADIAQAYELMNVLCFPSHYDAPGRPIFEAAFFSVPSIVAVRDPKSDTLRDGVTGIAIEPRNPLQLADAIERLARAPELARSLGIAARQMADENFGARRNATRLLDLYRRVLANGARS